MSDRILRSGGNVDDDNNNGVQVTTPPTTKTTTSRRSGQPAEHQDAENWTTVGTKSKKKGFGSEKSTRYKLRLQVYMNILNEVDGSNINVPKQQQLFCTELFKADASLNILKWQEQSNQEGTSKSNPITACSQLPTDKKNLSEWIAGTTANNDRNNRLSLKFCLYVETSLPYMNLRKAMKPWLDYYQHRLFITKLSTTNNRLLAWIKDAHPDWTRIDDLRQNLQAVIDKNLQEDEISELDLRPRRTRIGQGVNAIFIWTIGITCGHEKVDRYMKALLKGLGKTEIKPAGLQHIRIIPFNPIKGLVSNNELSALARDHDNLMDSMRKKSILGFADIEKHQRKTTTDDEEDKLPETITMHQFLLSQETRAKTKLFHSIESRGKNGYMVLYKQHNQTEVEEFFDNMQDIMKQTFHQEFIEEYFNSIKAHLTEIEIDNQNSAISKHSAVESYYQEVTSTINEIQFSKATSPASSVSTSGKSGKFKSRKRSQEFNLNYSDDISSVGNKSANQINNAWESPLMTTHRPRSNDRDDTSSVATLKTEVQSWFDDLKAETKNDWEQSIKNFNNLNEKLTEVTNNSEHMNSKLAAVTESNEKLHAKLESIENNHHQALQEQRDLLENIIKNNLKHIVEDSVSRTLQKQQMQMTSSPIRKQQKTTLARTSTNSATRMNTQKSIEDYVNMQSQDSDSHSSAASGPRDYPGRSL